MSYSLQLNQSYLDKLNGNQLNTGFTRMVTDLLNRAKINAPYKTGALRNSGYMRSTGQLRYKVGFTVPYARYNEYHNRRHPYFLSNARNAVAARTASYFEFTQ